MPKQTQWLLLALGAAVGLYLFSRTAPGQSAVTAVSNYVGDLLTPHGIRNNNPGNIERNSITWDGALTAAEVAAAGLTWDPVYVQFATPAKGVRAIGHVLRSKSARGLTNVHDIIFDYSKTDQAAYSANVSAALGVGEGDTIDVFSVLPAFATAIIQQENGQQPYADADITNWVYS